MRQAHGSHGHCMKKNEESPLVWNEESHVPIASSELLEGLESRPVLQDRLRIPSACRQLIPHTAWHGITALNGGPRKQRNDFTHPA